jgi:hypothetical protein
MNVFTLPMALFLAVAASGMWAFVGVVSWAEIRRKEREAYYKHETMKKISEMPGETGLHSFAKTSGVLHGAAAKTSSWAG